MTPWVKSLIQTGDNLREKNPSCQAIERHKPDWFVALADVLTSPNWIILEYSVFYTRLVRVEAVTTHAVRRVILAVQVEYGA